MISEHQQGLRQRLLGVAVTAAPPPWRLVCHPLGIGGLTGVGFSDDGELLMVVSHSGRGVFDAVTGVLLARDRDPDSGIPDGADLSCSGLGPLSGQQIRIAGLFGGGLHTGTEDGWTVDVVSPDWPHQRVILSVPGGSPFDGEAQIDWWHILHADHSELRAAGFSASGLTLAIATSSDLTLLVRHGARAAQ